jgi:putative membrane protein
MIEYDQRSWLRVAVGIRGSVVPRAILRALVVGLAGLAVLYVDVAFPWHAHAIVGVALASLLGVRVHASYGRWVEARATLDRLVGASRDLARQLGVYVPEDGDASVLRREVGRYIGAFYRLLVQRMRRDEDLAELGSRLGEIERAELGELPRGRELAVLSWISARLVALQRGAVVTDSTFTAMDRNVSSMVRAVGACERIARTPFPFAFAQYTKVLLVLFCVTLPFVMADVLQIWTPVASIAVAFALFGIEQIGVELDDPFARGPNELPLDELGDAVDDAVRRAQLLSGVLLQAPGEEVDELFVATA